MLQLQIQNGEDLLNDIELDVLKKQLKILFLLSHEQLCLQRAI